VRTAGLVFLTLWALISGSAASADDYFAGVGIGGIELRKTDAISMRREDLFLSTGQVRAAFEFENLTPNDATATVAFPLPAYALHDENDPLCDEGQCGVDKALARFNFVSFATRVNGSPVQARVETKAYAGDRDITALLEKYSVPLTEGWPDLSALKKLPAAAQDELRDAGLWGPEGFIMRNWRVRKTFHWEQVFPAGKITRIEHAYRPILGSGQNGGSLGAHEREAFCIDGPADAALRALKSKSRSILFTDELDYVLTTANSWSGPIKDFRLTIEKPEGSILSLCFDGLKRAGPRRFEARRSNFAPQNELRLLFVHP
jgi:hypothetical protein